MISLRKSLSELDQMEELFRTSLQCYISALGSIEAHQVEADSRLLAEHRRRLTELRRRVASDPTVPSLQSSSRQLEEELRDYSLEVGGLFRHKQQEIKRILGILAEAADTLSSSSNSYATQLREVARELESASRLSSLSDIRRCLASGVAALKQCTESMHNSNLSSVSSLRRELQSFQQRLERAELLAATDPLTGLPNRREAERLIADCIQQQSPFSIMLFDLDAFKDVNDKHGHSAGDQVLRLFAKRLAQQFRPEDTTCRWGGDEFLVIFHSGLADALAAAARAGDNVRGAYPVHGAHELTIYVSASVGVAEHRPGETAEQMFTRADAYLYRDKNRPSASDACKLEHGVIL